MQLYKRTLELIIFFLFGLIRESYAQDSGKVLNDSILLNASDSAIITGKAIDSVVKTFNLDSFYLLNKQVPLNGAVSKYLEVPFDPSQKDYVFYIIVGIFVLLCILKLLFGKYLADLIKLFFQTTFRQVSIREQLLQNTAASLSLNLFFCISFGEFIYFYGINKGWIPETHIAEYLSVIILGITLVYIFKYLMLRFFGWIFNMRSATDTYLFVIFLINKIAGFILLPATVILSLGSENIKDIVTTITFVLLALFYLYRAIITFPIAKTNTGLNVFHFFVYICALELLPLVIIYKTIQLSII